MGRTLPIWNKHLKNPQFANDEPWLLKFFDQVRYYPVSEAQLDEMRDAFRHGHLQIDITEEPFSLAEHRQFLADNADSIARFTEQRDAAYREEVARWQNEDAAIASAMLGSKTDIGEVNGHLISAEISGNVWKLLVDEGAQVTEGQPVVVVEAMKMEFEILANASGKVTGLHCQPGAIINAGDPVLVIDTEAVA